MDMLWLCLRPLPSHWLLQPASDFCELERPRKLTRFVVGRWLWERRPANAAICRASHWHVCVPLHEAKKGSVLTINYQLHVAETSRQRRGFFGLDENAVSVFLHTPSLPQDPFLESGRMA